MRCSWNFWRTKARGWDRDTHTTFARLLWTLAAAGREIRNHRNHGDSGASQGWIVLPLTCLGGIISLSCEKAEGWKHGAFREHVVERLRNQHWLKLNIISKYPFCLLLCLCFAGPLARPSGVPKHCSAVLCFLAVCACVHPTAREPHVGSPRCVLEQAAPAIASCIMQDWMCS